MTRGNDKKGEAGQPVFTSVNYDPTVVIRTIF